MTRREDALFTRFRATGDPAALAAVFDRVAPDLLAVALHLCGRRADAEDLVQDTFLVAIQRAAAWDPGRGLFPWLVGILTRRRHGQRRAEARRPDPERLREPTSEDPACAAQHRELDSALVDAVASLGEVYRPVLHLHLRHGLDAKEIAAALGRPPGTVRTQVVRGLERLRESLPAGLKAAFAADLALARGRRTGDGIGEGHGLSAVRAVVLERARSHATAAGLSTAVAAPSMFGIGLLMTKQTWLVAGALLLASALWYASRASTADPRPAAPQDGAAATLPTDRRADLELPTSPPERAGAGVQRTAAPESPAPVPAAARVTVRVVGVLPPPGSATAPELVVPLAGVTVELWPGHGEEPPFVGRRRVLETDEDGLARFQVLDPGPCTVDVVARPVDPLSGAQQPRRVEAAAGAETRVEVALPIAVLAHGRVVDEAGSPIAGAEVWAGDGFIGRQALPQHLLRRVARSGRDGTFHAPLAPHEERLAARKEGYADSPALATAVLGAAEVEWTLVLGRELARVRGTVRDARHRPLTSVAVALQRGGETLERRADGVIEQGHLPLLLRSDARGDFAAELTAGTYECRAVGPSGSAATTFQVAAGETAFVELTFPDAVAVRGVVRTPAGAPVPSLPVWIEEVAPDGERGDRITRTLSDGSFLFLGIPRRPFVVEAGRLGGRLRARSEQPAPTGSLVDCELTFDDPPPLRGRVLRAGGAAAGGLAVQARSTADEYLTGTTCDDEGRFALRELAAGPYRLVVARSVVPGGRVLLEFEGTLDPASILELRLPAERGALRGRAVDERGAPVRGVTLTLSAPDEGARSAESAEDGRFSFEGVPPVRSTLRARADRRAFVGRTVEVGGEGVTDVGDVVVPSEAGLEVRVHRPDGTPWTDAPPVPWLRRDGALLAGRDRVEYALRDGKVVVHGLAPGTYELQPALGDALTFAPITVELRGGLVTQLDLHMRTGRPLELELEAPPPGSAPMGVELTVRDARGAEVLRRIVPPPSFLATRWVVEHTLPVGTCTAQATGPDGTRWLLEFEVRAEGDQPSRILVPRR